VRRRGLGGALVEQPLAQLGAQLAQPGRGGRDQQRRLAVLGSQGRRVPGGGAGRLVGAALVVQREGHELEVGEDAGQRAEGVHQQGGRRHRGVEQARRLDRLVHGRVDAPRQQLDAGVPGESRGPLQVVVRGVEGGLGRTDQRDRQRRAGGLLGASIPGVAALDQVRDAGVQVERLGAVHRVADQREAGLAQPTDEQLGAEGVGPGLAQGVLRIAGVVPGAGVRGGVGGRVPLDTGEQFLGLVQLPVRQCGGHPLVQGSRRHQRTVHVHLGSVTDVSPTTPRTVRSVPSAPSPEPAHPC
jgi:hypothetical protein